MWRSVLLAGTLAFLANAGAQDAGHRAAWPAAMRLNEIIGIVEVLTPEGRSLGPITDLYFDPANGTIQEIAVGANRFPVSALLSGDAPGQVLIVPTAAAAAGGTALRARTGKEALSPASREGGPDSVIVDLLQGRLRR
jgi:sporulation protein YlmC with PRC-barrel domain